MWTVATACLDANSLVAIAAGDPERLAGHEPHLDACAECRAIVSQLVDEDPDGLGPRFFPGQSIGRFALIRPRGAGGMGLVFEARDTVLDRRVALKLVRVAGARDDLLRESRALARLNHPNVVTLYDVGYHGDEVYLAMELVEGQTLAEWLATPRDRAELLSVFRQAGRGLAAIHAAGQIHRDIKPANILIGDDGRVRVSDFGLAVECTDATPAIAGTPRYMPPEVRAGEPATERSDQWGLAATFRDAIATSGSTRSARVERSLERALADDPAARFASVDALVRALHPPGLRRPLILAALAAALGSVAAVAWTAREPAASEPCAEVAAPVDAVWGAQQHLALTDRILRAGLPLDEAARVTVALDQQARSWSAVRTSACVAGNRNGREQAEMAARQIACLDRHLAQLHAVIDAVVTSPKLRAIRGIDASDAVLALPPVDDCADSKHLFELEQLPAVPARRAALLTLQQSVETALARYRVSHEVDDLRGPWLDEAIAATDYAPLEARALELVVIRQRAMLDPAAPETARRAHRAAQAAGDQVLQVGAAIHVLDALVLAPADAEQAEWIAAGAEAQITALQRRMPETAADLRYQWLRAYGAALVVTNRLEDAIARLREALALARKLYGAEDYRAARAAGVLSTVVLRAGNYDEAVELVRAAVPAMERVLPARSLDLAGTYLNAAYAYHFHGEHERALRYATIAADWLRGTSDEPRVVEFIADIHGAMGHWAAAGQALDAAIARTPDAARLRTRAGCVARADRSPTPTEALAIATCFMADRRFHMVVAVLEPALAALADARPTRRVVELRFLHAQALAYRSEPGDDARAEQAARAVRRDCARARDCGALAIEIERWIAELTS